MADETVTTQITDEQGQGGLATALAPEAEQDAYQYDIQIEDAGPATKRVHVNVPQDRIGQKMTEQFKELRKQAAVRGFRPGHAPQKLVEKMYASDVRDQVRRSLISESYDQAIKKNGLNVIGDPEFDDADKIELPTEGDLKFSFSVEIQPQIFLPPLTNLRVRKPKITVTDANVDEAMLNLRQQYGGTLIPVEDRAVEKGDYLVADVHVKLDGNVVEHQHDAQIVARKGRIAGIEADLGEQLAGLKVGEKRDLSAHAPASHPNEAIRDKDVQIEVSLKDIKQMELPAVDEKFLSDLGFNNVEELRHALHERMEEQIKYDVQQSMREQVNNYLLQSVHMDLPSKLSDRQIERVAQRKAMDQLMRGLPREQVLADLEALKRDAAGEAVRELKLFFILQKVAAEQQVDVTEAELNGRIAMLAAQRGQRPEKLKQEMSKDGSLASVYIQMREQRALDKVLSTAHVEEVDPMALGAPRSPEGESGQTAAAPAQSAPAESAPVESAPDSSAQASSSEPSRGESSNPESSST